MGVGRSCAAECVELKGGRQGCIGDPAATSPRRGGVGRPVPCCRLATTISLQKGKVKSQLLGCEPLGTPTVASFGQGSVKSRTVEYVKEEGFLTPFQGRGKGRGQGAPL